MRISFHAFLSIVLAVALQHDVNGENDLPRFYEKWWNDKVARLKSVESSRRESEQMICPYFTLGYDSWCTKIQNKKIVNEHYTKNRQLCDLNTYDSDDENKRIEHLKNDPEHQKSNSHYQYSISDPDIVSGFYGGHGICEICSSAVRAWICLDICKFSFFLSHPHASAVWPRGGGSPPLPDRNPDKMLIKLLKLSQIGRDSE